MKLSFTLATILSLSACSQGPVSTSGSATKLEPTSSLVSRPEVQEIVDELAKGMVTSAGIGYGGAPSPSYAVFERLRAAATDVEMIALVQHKSPVVRSYAAQHVIEKNLGLDHIDPLLADGEMVETLFGCIHGNMSVATLTIQWLCGARTKAATEKLEGVAKGTGDLADRAQRCISGT